LISEGVFSFFFWNCCLIKMSKSSTMFVVMGLVVLIVASTLVPSSVEAAANSCSIYQLLPCLSASKSLSIPPSRQCCINVAAMGRGPAGANCLCSLLNNPLARSQGVQPRIAITIPRRCRLPVPKGQRCNGEY
jgi:hypothetical protein